MHGLTMSSLAAIVACSGASLAGPDDALLCIGGEPVATLAAPQDTAALVARVGPSATLADLAGTLIATRPSGLLVLASPDGEFFLAVSLFEGRVVSAAGPDAMQNMGTWVIEFHRRAAEARGSRVEGDDAAVMRALRPGRMFVIEAVLCAFARCDQTSASLLLLQGPHHWLHETLEAPAAPDLGFLLMEHARRGDEMANVEASLGSANGPIVALTRPAERPAARPSTGDGADWDFFDDPDPAAEAEWLDARFVFDFCDGSTDLDGLVERTMLGRFRTVSAVVALAQRKHIQVIADEYADLICDLAS